MKIVDFSVTMSKWASPAWQTATAAFGSEKLLGVLTLRTDDGVEGHAFLGSSRQGADAFVRPLMEFVKPMVMASNPMDIGGIWAKMWPMNRSVSTNAIGASGMVRFAEVAMQVRGQAGEHQIDGAKKVLGHAYGGGSQYFSMWILGDKPL